MDVTYVRNFIRETAPAWLDHVALVSGMAPPLRHPGFSWCDLGCGPGANAAIMAATHPHGSFVGIDFLPAHIEEADFLANDARIPNIHFHELDFAAATPLDFGGFDYIVSHGVYTWIDRTARDQWLGFIDRHLKPGGLLYVSYNAMPGRAADLPLQRLVRALGGALQGNTRDRMQAAFEVVDSMNRLKAPALVSSPMMQRLTAHRGRFDPDYLAHELMVSGWEPQCVTDVRAHLAQAGLKPVGSATLVENYDKFVLGRPARQLLATIEDPDARELARDFMIDQFFRRDVFVRAGRVLDASERRRRLMNSAFWLSDPAGEVKYHLATPAGRLTFDNPAARHIVECLAAGPRRLADLPKNAAISESDLLANALALSAALTIWPVEPDHVPVDNINRALEGRYHVIGCGTAVRVGKGA
jgi:SAM-dependent methyltransferase